MLLMFSRKAFQFQLGVAVAFVLCCCTQEEQLVQGLAYEELSLTAQPNIVWIVAEDLSAFIPPFGDSTVRTPHLDRLAREGVRYTHFFSPSGVCAPSRAAIALGMYPTRIGANHMRTGPWVSFYVPERIVEEQKAKQLVYEAMPPAGVHMYSTYLRERGYYCTNNHKQDYQFRCELTAWDESSREAHYKNRAPGQPFFAVFNLMETHESRLWIKEKDSLWVDETLTVPLPPYLPDTEVVKKNMRRLYSNIKEMDFQVGKILDELEKNGLLEKTIVFWYSDHGGPIPRHKRTIYDTGIRAPMIIRFPNQQLAGKVDSQLLNFIDLKPTVLSLAGIPPPDYLDGQAWMGTFASTSPRRYIHAAADRFDYWTDRIRAVRDQRFKYIRNYLPEKSYYLPVKYREEIPMMKEMLRLREEKKLNEVQALWFREKKEPEELFDTYTDPYELHNLAADPRYAKKMSELSSEMDRWLAAGEDTGLIPEEEYFASIWPAGEQPVTKAPVAKKSEGKWILNCETAGASIGYQWIEKNGEPSRRWLIYKEPIDEVPGKVLIARAHRIGFYPSDLVETELPF